METQWNRPPFRLHYVTAREAYNIAKAAEQGHSGDPNDFRDYVIPQPANRLVSCTSPWRLLSATPERLHVGVMGNRQVRLGFAGRELRSISGRIAEVDARWRGTKLASLQLKGEGPFEVVPPRRREAVHCGVEADYERLVRYG